MPRLHEPQLRELAARILIAAGVTGDDAATIAAELAEANMVGHDSHGVMRLVQYVDYVQRGLIRPDGCFEILRDEPSLLIVDGNFQFGQVTATRALKLGLAKAGATGSATIVIRNGNHVGRLGSYTQQAAIAGCAAMMAVNAPGPGGVAPYGGIDRRLGTNPLSIAAPRGERPLVLDMTSSASAEGKLRVAYQKGERVPEGWIIDAEGNASTDPAVFYATPSGALLPLGGALGFKGFGLAVMIDVFAGMLSGSGVCRTDLPPGANGVWLYLLDVEHFLPRAEYDALMERYVAWLKSSRRLAGVDEILLPGEIELRRREQRAAEGVEVPAETWRQLCELAGRLGVSLEDVAAKA
ncbi:MAG: Ldh family oxidoreductase [Planctomycetes bacterium]|nr:Ldh family oxidoreductase [Planctomycetota bacterium]